MRTKDLSGNPIPPAKLLKELNKRADALWIIADEVYGNADDVSGMKIAALASGAKALIEDIEMAAASAELHEKAGAA